MEKTILTPDQVRKITKKEDILHLKDGKKVVVLDTFINGFLDKRKRFHRWCDVIYTPCKGYDSFEEYVYKIKLDEFKKLIHPEFIRQDKPNEYGVFWSYWLAPCITGLGGHYTYAVQSINNKHSNYNNYLVIKNEL